MVAYNNKKYYIDILETKPSSAVSIIETDCEVDFAPPLDYREPKQLRTSVFTSKALAQGFNSSYLWPFHLKIIFCFSLICQTHPYL